MDDAPQLKHKYGRIDKDYAMALATRAPEDDGPIYMVNLMKYHEVAQYTADASVDKPISGREADDRYNPASILAKIGAAIVFVGDVVGNHVGSEDWDRIAVVRYPSRKSFIDMQSRKDFSEKHVHKAAGMQRTIIVCCRPQDLSLDTRGRPQADDDRHIVMIVRRTSDRVAAFAAVPNAVNLTAEGTIIGDGRAWDTVQFLAVASASDAESLAKSVTATANGDAYVMTVRASMDAITQG
ncbi:MAG: hypothetical protein JHC86_00925 [Ilumatobacteraceae bacterium]|nr:hypothetical protein [Ilumatobacteraceae bacterium]